MRRRNTRRGGAMVEFALVLFLLISVIFAGIDFDRLLLVHTTVANSARAGVRYAIVHGSSRTGAMSSDDIKTVVKSFAKIGTVDVTKDGFSVDVSFPGTGNPGSEVTVTVNYTYDPLAFLPAGIKLSSSSSGVIVF